MTKHNKARDEILPLHDSRDDIALIVPPRRIGPYNLPYNNPRPLSRGETSRDHRRNGSIKREKKESSRPRDPRPGMRGYFNPPVLAK